MVSVSFTFLTMTCTKRKMITNSAHKIITYIVKRQKENVFNSFNSNVFFITVES